MPRLTVEQAAEYIPLSVSTLNHLRVAGGGPIYIKLVSKVLYDTDDLDAWMRDNKRKSTSAAAAPASPKPLRRAGA